MDYDTFIGEVQNRGQLPSREDAVTVTRITLETVSERVGSNEADDLAAQLPEEIGRYLDKIDEAEQFSWDEFVDRLLKKGDYDGRNDGASAIHHARVVMDVVDDAATEGEIEDVRSQLSSEFDELFAVADQAQQPVEEEQRPEG